MLSSHVVSKLNDQIKSELRTVDSTFSDNDEKMAALDRIAKISAILNQNTVLVITTDPEPTDDVLTTALSALATRLKR